MIYNSEDKPVPYALPGENIKLLVKGIDEQSGVKRGSMITRN